MAKTRGKFKLTRADKGLDRLEVAMKEFGRAGGKQLRVGVFDQSKHPGGDGVTVAEVAAIHEYGSPDAGLPQRSFIGATFDKNRRRYVALLKQGLRDFYGGEGTVEQALVAVGSQMRSDIQRFIRDDQVRPPHSPATIARKRAKGIRLPRTLIDTGTLVNAIDFKVDRGSGGP